MPRGAARARQLSFMRAREGRCSSEVATGAADRRRLDSIARDEEEGADGVSSERVASLRDHDGSGKRFRNERRKFRVDSEKLVEDVEGGGGAVVLGGGKEKGGMAAEGDGDA